jgi:hypothetical protein
MNGWTNYETWAAVSWGCDILDTDLVSEIVNRRGVPRYAKINELADALREYFEEVQEQTLGRRVNGTIFADLLENATSRINWREIATHIYDDAEVEDEVEDEDEDEA